MALIKRNGPTLADYRRAFLDTSKAVIEYRAYFDGAFEAAQTDSERYRLAKAFPTHLANLYHKVDQVLDHYLEHRNEQLQQRMPDAR